MFYINFYQRVQLRLKLHQIEINSSQYPQSSAFLLSNKVIYDIVGRLKSLPQYKICIVFPKLLILFLDSKLMKNNDEIIFHYLVNNFHFRAGNKSKHKKFAARWGSSSSLFGSITFFFQFVVALDVVLAAIFQFLQSPRMRKS